MKETAIASWIPKKNVSFPNVAISILESAIFQKQHFVPVRPHKFLVVAVNEEVHGRNKQSTVNINTHFQNSSCSILQIPITMENKQISNKNL